MLDLDPTKRHYRHLERMPIQLEIGALHVDVIKINYVPPGPGWHVPEHKHSSYEFHFITSGKGHICMDQIPFHVETNQFYLTGPEIIHAQYSDQHEPMAELCLQCQFTLKKNADRHHFEEAKQLLDIFNTPVYSSIPDVLGAIPQFMSCAEEANHQFAGYYAAIQSRLAGVIISTARMLAGEDEQMANYSVPAKREGYEVILETILFLEDNYQNPITLEQVADHVHFSPRHLGRMFKLVTDKTMNRYLTEIRLNRALHLLRQSDYSLDRIAQEIGFANGSYLSQLFRRVYGHPPSEQRTSTSTNI
ncbi:AraC family transcriptional regulator [Paenibacillus sp. CF384]|uniref:AraC family transcriptional regulator n=1 Tax=Paenibacillus sp. CF384 TaxID=1884382 RepID=UPI000897D57E|nr:AraC family transcriptional regulator [Paenibacillus sp. CF384]SDW12328.1 transcriptional regulator, AraC family [Paenibacillus sp. CF384]